MHKNQEEETLQTSFLPRFSLRTVQIWILSIMKCGAWCKSNLLVTNP